MRKILFAAAAIAAVAATPALARTRAARVGRDRGARPQAGRLSGGSQFT